MIHLAAITFILDEASQLALTIASSDLEEPMSCTKTLEGLPDGTLGYQTNESKSAPIVFDPDAPRRGRQLSAETFRRLVRGDFKM